MSRLLTRIVSLLLIASLLVDPALASDFSIPSKSLRNEFLLAFAAQALSPTQVFTEPATGLFADHNKPRCDALQQVETQAGLGSVGMNPNSMGILRQARGPLRMKPDHDGEAIYPGSESYFPESSGLKAREAVHSKVAQRTSPDHAIDVNEDGENTIDGHQQLLTSHTPVELREPLWWENPIRAPPLVGREAREVGLPEPSDVQHLYRLTRPWLKKTPLLEVPDLAMPLTRRWPERPVRVFVKYEPAQETGSYKPRGVL